MTTDITDAPDIDAAVAERIEQMRVAEILRAIIRRYDTSEIVLTVDELDDRDPDETVHIGQEPNGALRLILVNRKEWQARPVTVHALQVEDTDDSVQRVAAWCGGTPGSNGSFRWLDTGEAEGPNIANPGDWVVRLTDRHVVLADHVFRAIYGRPHQ